MIGVGVSAGQVRKRGKAKESERFSQQVRPCCKRVTAGDSRGKGGGEAYG